MNPLPAEHNIDTYRGHIKIRNSTFLSLVMDCIKVMEPLHRTQLLGVHANYKSKDHLTRTDYNTLTTIFTRYKDKLQSEIEPDSLTSTGEKFGEAIAVGFIEAESFEEEINKRSEELRGSSSSGNFEIRKVPVG